MVETWQIETKNKHTNKIIVVRLWISDKSVLIFRCYCGSQADRHEGLGPWSTLQCWVSFGVEAVMAGAETSSGLLDYSYSDKNLKPKV